MAFHEKLKAREESGQVAAEPVGEVQHTRCCIVGAGPAGAMLALLLVRRGVPVVLLEAHKDFDRDFRGDTIHPSTLDILAQLGLADRLLEIPHGTIRKLQIVTPEGTQTAGDFGQLSVRYPFIAMLPQVHFLEFLTAEARHFPEFHLVLGANVQRPVHEGGVVQGVRFQGADGAWQEVRAALTVAADGRFSRLRSLTGLKPVKTAPPMDVVWFRLPRRPGDLEDAGAFHIGAGHFAVLLERAEEWQVGYVIFKGGYPRLRAAGIEALRNNLVTLIPWLAERVDCLKDWHQVSVLSVESSRLKRWYLPGLLLIGDAAHVMSPVGGVGINYAVQDAVEAANLLAERLRKGRVRTSDLAAVQRRREWPVRVIQMVQAVIQDRIAAQALRTVKPFRVPLFLRVLNRLPLLGKLLPRLVGYGIWRVRVEG